MKYLYKILSAFVLANLFACQEAGPQKINFGKDQCDLCKMNIEDAKFGAELITEKGRIYKFDDVNCMKTYESENTAQIGKAKLYVADFITTELFPIENATFLSGGAIKSPMNGNLAAFRDKAKAEQEAQKLGANVLK